MCIGCGMLKIELPASEPPPQFATDAEVAFAQRLRQQLEQRYLGNAIETTDLVSPGEVH